MTHQPKPYRYVDADDFCLSARLLPDLDNGGFTETLSITIEGSDEPQSVHIPLDQVENLIAGLRLAAGAVSAAVAPPTNQTALRDRIALAIEDAPFRPDERRSLQLADAVLAVLPEPTDKAAVLRWAADHLDRYVGLQSSDAAPEVEGARLVIRELRRMADETPDTQTEAHAPLTEWRVEILDGDEWMPASGLRRDRSQAAEQLRLASERRPLWNDGTRVQRRLVRQTTTYTVEQPAAGQGQDGTQTPGPRDQHRAAWHALTPDQQTARIAELDQDDEPAAGARQDGAQP
ncbi:hypothetical protein [Streptomyces sp. ECR3.8]|uniref:hypothetical protein n=1 Tax=Streptomyces sp. ECR3.8 TaxID=3461009 RepID=UPI0040421315